VLEVDEGVAVSVEMGAHFCVDGFHVGRRVVGHAVAVINEVGSDHVGAFQLFTFCDAEGGIAALQNFVNFIGEPGFVPELESEPMEARDIGQEFAEQRGIGLQERRKLDEDDAELPCLLKRLEGFEKKAHGFAGIFEAKDVGDALVSLGTELETFGCGVDPRIEAHVGDAAAEGVINFDGIELSGVVREKFCRGKLGRIKIGFPTCVSPSGGACVKISHEDA